MASRTSLRAPLVILLPRSLVAARRCFSSAQRRFRVTTAFPSPAPYYLELNESDIVVVTEEVSSLWFRGYKEGDSGIVGHFPADAVAEVDKAKAANTKEKSETGTAVTTPAQQHEAGAGTEAPRSKPHSGTQVRSLSDSLQGVDSVQDVPHPKQWGGDANW
jgi:hypothetical protein